MKPVKPWTPISGKSPAPRLNYLNVLPPDIDQIVLHGYPRTLRKLYLDAPVTLLEKLGSVSALLDLQALRPIIAQTAKS